MTLLTTSIREQSLYSMAFNAKLKAQDARHEAFCKAEKDPTRANIQAFMDADKAFRTAEENLEQVRMMQKHNRRMQ